MKRNTLLSAILSISAAVALCLAFSPALSTAIPAFAQNQGPQAGLSPGDKQVVATFEARVKEYVKLRESLEGKLPKLSQDATPEQIEKHKTTFQEIVRAARSGAKRGDIFTPEAAALIRATIKREFKGTDRQELRKTVLVEADTKAIPLRVNYPYPESEELLEMPPTLLLKLPQLPKQVKYRFVGRNMLLVDRENGLIIDYMLDAVP
ncbi:MAG TPA: hypothetical protein VF544_16580 [Pyrinomonadaceae bacterium]|jgi:hypothetical protein